MTFAITATKREGKADQTRSEGQIPAVLYGPEIESQPVSVDYRTFEKLYQEAGESNLVDLTLDGGSAAKVLIQEVQTDPVKGTIVHADFRQINMNKEMSAAVEIHLVGESAAVKEQGGTLIKGPDTVNVTCLPKDLVGSIEVDLGVLNTFDDVIQVKDLQLPTGITVTDNEETVIAKVSAPLTEEQLKAMEETSEASVEDVEVEEKGKAEEGSEEGGEEKKEEAPAAEEKKAE